MKTTNSTVPKAIAIIQARCSSSRLPGKVLKPLASKPMIWHIVQRAQACRHVDQVVVATSTEPSDDPLAALCAHEEMACFRGSLNNVLSRYIALLERQPHAYVVRITGDCPLIHPLFIDRQIEVLHRYDADLVHLTQPSSMLEGQGVHSSRSLKKVAESSSHLDDLEHVGSRFFCEQSNLFRAVELQTPTQFQGTQWRVTVDEAADYALMAQLYAQLYKGDPIPLEQACLFLQNNPKLASCNKSVEHSQVNKELCEIRNAMQAAVLATVPW